MNKTTFILTDKRIDRNAERIKEALCNLSEVMREVYGSGYSTVFCNNLTGDISVFSDGNPVGIYANDRGLKLEVDTGEDESGKAVLSKRGYKQEIFNYIYEREV